MELIRAASYGIAYFLLFSALAGVVTGRRRSWVAVAVAGVLVMVLAWTLSAPRAPRVGLVVVVTLVCLVVTGLFAWDAGLSPLVRARIVPEAIEVPPLPPRRAAVPGQPPWRAPVVVPAPPSPPPPPANGQFDWVRPVVEPPRRAVGWTPRTLGAPLISEPYRSDPG